MNEIQGRQLMAALGVKPEYKGGWLRAKCPLAPWRHKGGKDSSPSFGVKVVPSGKSHYHCFACSSGSLSSLIQALEMHTDYGAQAPTTLDLQKARQIVDLDESTVYPLPEYSEFPTTDHVAFQAWPEAALEAFPLATSEQRSLDYLKWRGFTPEEADSQDLRVDLYRDMLVFPYRNFTGLLGGMRGRLMDFGQKQMHQMANGEIVPALKHYDYVWGEINNAHACWLGEECLEKADAPVVIVEGQFDRMRVLRVYPYVLANMTAKPSDYKLQKLLGAPGVVALLDDDETGHMATVKWMNRLAAGGLSQVGCVELAGAPKSEFHIGRDGSGSPKDPDETDEQWLKEALSSLL